MKTSVQTLFASALLAICLAATAFTSSASVVNVGSAMSIPAAGIQKVILKGNVRVLLIQSEQESVRIYDMYNTDKTSVKMEGGALVINSTEDEPIHMTVFVKNLFRIEASNTVSVQTKGQFNLQFLQIILNDKARANVNACTKGLYTVVRDKSNLTLAGTSDEHFLIRSKVCRLQTEDFACLKTNDSYLENQLAKDTIKSVVMATSVLKSR